MNAAHFHLMFTHLPIVGVGFAFLLNFVAVLWNNQDLRKLSCWFYIVTGVLSVLAILTGDGAGEIVKTYPGISADTVEYHETWGYVFFYCLLAVSALSALALWYAGSKPDLMKKFMISLLAFAIVALVFAYQAGTTGGTIRHPEIENGPYR